MTAEALIGVIMLLVLLGAIKVAEVQRNRK